jgi:putative restriction endonuclease
MRIFVAVTDNEWFRFLAENTPDEVNFWRPKTTQAFRALSPNEPFLFKLHSPLNSIVGGGFFVRHSALPLSLAWEAFGEKNGASTLAAFHGLVESIRGSGEPDPEIGCTILADPFFFPQQAWIPVPRDWARNIVIGKTYDTHDRIGSRLWEDVLVRIAGRVTTVADPTADEASRYGEPALVHPRMGQGGFRVSVTEAYRRRCAVSGERTLPVLHAAHIRPYSESGPHRVSNGLLLRSDLHILFDRGYITVDSDLHLVVSQRIREQFENGRDYYAMHGRPLISVPEQPQDHPGCEFLAYHNEQVFRDT